MCVLNVVECTYMNIYWHNACINTHTHKLAIMVEISMLLHLELTGENDDLQK